MKNSRTRSTAPRRLALAFGTVLASSAALAQVQLYGTIDAAVGQIESQPNGAPNTPIQRVRGVFNGGAQTSYFGIRANEDLGDGLRARFILESFLRVDTGQNGRFDATPGGGADAFWSREAYVALGNRFGEVRLGNNATPVWIAMLQTNALGANSVFSPSFRQLFNGGARAVVEADTAMVNSVKYQAPTLGGVDGSVVLQPGEGSGRFSYSANLGYRAGPLTFSAAYANFRHAAVPNFPGARDQSVYLLGGAYDFGIVRLFAQYTDITNDRLGTKDKLPHFGFSVPIGVGQVQFSTGSDKTSGKVTAKRTTSSLGYVYALSKRTDVYTFAMREEWMVGTGNSAVVGVRHRF